MRQYLVILIYGDIIGFKTVVSVCLRYCSDYRPGISNFRLTPEFFIVSRLRVLQNIAIFILITFQTLCEKHSSTVVLASLLRRQTFHSSIRLALTLTRNVAIELPSLLPV